MNKVVIVVVLVAFGLFMRETGKSAQLSAMRDTYIQCMNGHGDTTAELEQACGDAQIKTHTKFSCGLAGNCYLEVK